MTQEEKGNTENSPAPKVEGPRIGVYICHCGGNISDVVDVEKVVEAVAGLPNVVVARDNTFMCSDPGQNLIAEDIRDKKLNRVVVAACSPSLHEHTFRRTVARARLNPYLYEHANIREQVSWCSKSDPQGATDKATRLVGAAIAKARLLEPLEPIRVNARQHVVIPMLVIEVPFGKWAHLAYRPLVIYLMRVKERAYEATTVPAVAA